jgi:hypothetical protein
MNLKPILRYQVQEAGKVFIAVYCSIICVFIINITATFNSSSSIPSVFGVESSSMLACFLVGLIYFKTNFRFFTSFSVSRKRLFFGFMIAFAAITFLVSLIDATSFAVFSRFFEYRSIYSFMVDDLPKDGTVSVTVALFFRNWLWDLLEYFCLVLVGLIVGVLYYRMSKPVKIIVSVGVPSLCFLILPLIDRQLMHGTITHFVSTAVTQWINLSTQPGPDFLSRFVLAALLSGLFWLLLRRAELKT